MRSSGEPGDIEAVVSRGSTPWISGDIWSKEYVAPGGPIALMEVWVWVLCPAIPLVSRVAVVNGGSGLTATPAAAGQSIRVMPKFGLVLAC